jgi:hypothetical protein
VLIRLGGEKDRSDERVQYELRSCWKAINQPCVSLCGGYAFRSRDSPPFASYQSIESISFSDASSARILEYGDIRSRKANEKPALQFPAPKKVMRLEGLNLAIRS